MPLTNRQCRLVAMSFAQLVPLSTEATAMFYNRLWEIAPETRSLFRAADMQQQGMKLMQTLGVTVRALHDLDSIAPMLHELGRRHMGYGVTAQQYEWVKVALLWMIERCLGDDFTPEVCDAWDTAYDMIAEITTSVYAS